MDSPPGELWNDKERVGGHGRVDEAMEQVMVIKSTRPTQTAVRGEICLENVCSLSAHHSTFTYFPAKSNKKNQLLERKFAVFHCQSNKSYYLCAN